MNIQIRITKQTVKKLEYIMNIARLTGDSRTLKRIMAVLSVIEGFKYSVIASVLKVCDESVRIWVKNFLLRVCKKIT